MKNYRASKIIRLATLAAITLLVVSADKVATAAATVVARNQEYHGKTYEEWSASWWKWALELPIVNAQGATHPFIDSPNFDVRNGQHGSVWFLGASFGADRSVTIPANKALFIGTINAECSTLEAAPFFGATAEDRRNCARSFADQIVASTLVFTINGTSVNLAAFRATSPDFKFSAPTPWIFGDPANNVGGKGRSTGDGYYVLLSPLPPGTYDISFGGEFGGPPTLTMTYHVTVSPNGDGDDSDN